MVDAAAAPSPFVIGSPIVLSPPPYDADADGADARPPPYYGCLDHGGHGGATEPPTLCSVADLPSVQPTAPSTSNNDNNDRSYMTRSQRADVVSGGHTPAYGNVAFSDSGV